MKLLFIMSVLILSFSLFAQEKESIDTKSESISTQSGQIDSTNDTNIINNYKDPFKAGLYSFIIPGLALGQLYNEDYLNFTIRLGVSALCFGVSYALIDSKKAPGIIAVSLLVYSINWVSSIFEASATAKNLNIKNKYKKNN